ncbi:MAG: phospholipid carrier-dependent glycosyltransferase [Propionibacteriaceae bacterium]|nr:phospholipid carrier-dependent glycosyltransferase [Propionibacteriaceae bacterium]
MDKLNAWLITLAITLFGLVVKLVNLGYPNKLVFDETFYAKDAYTLIQTGAERSWPEEVNGTPVNDVVVSGNVNVFEDNPAFVVHPPLGKWLIGLGEQLFGMNSFGWRFSAAIAGSVMVLLPIRLGRRIARSTWIGALAGLLLTLDGLTFVMSRVALLDIFQAMFLVAAVSACVADRDYYRRRIAEKLELRGVDDFGGEFGPVVWLRPWRLAAGVLFGLSVAVKWNSVYVLAVMGVLCVMWDVGARRLAGAGWNAWVALIIDGIPAFFRMVVVAVPVYIATWTGWFLTSGGYDRQWGADNPDDPSVKALGPDVASFLHDHIDIYNFHTGKYMMEEATPSYESHPWQWLFMIRPTAMDAVNDIQPGTDGCPLDQGECLRVITGMGTPLLWWACALALVLGFVWWIGDRDWRFGVGVLAAAASYVPWWIYSGRPTFSFYTITMIPFMCIELALCLALLLGPKRGPNRVLRGAAVGAFVGLVALNFAFIYPILTDEVLPRWQWLLRIWFPTWI